MYRVLDLLVVFINVVCSKFVNVDQWLGFAPFVDVVESFGVDICRLKARGYVRKVHVILVKLFFKPFDVDSVCSSEMTHGGIASRSANPNNSGVVFVELESVVVVKKDVP